MGYRKIITILCTAMLLAVTASGQRADDFRRHYDSGIELFRAGQYAAAQGEFERARTYPGAADGAYAEEIDYYLTLCAVESGAADATDRLTAFLTKYPRTLYADPIALALGRACLKEGRYAEALTQYDRVDASRLSAAGRGEYRFNRGYASFMNGDNTAALSEFAQVGDDRTFGPPATYYTAYIEYETGELDAARARFLTLSDDRSYGPIVPFYLLHIDFRKRDYSHVVQDGPAILQSAVGERRTEILRILGESWYRLENYPEALRHLDAYAAEKDGLTREEQYMIGEAAYMTGDFERAIALLGRVATGEDGLAQNASFHIGSASLRLGDKQRAKQAFSLAMRLDTDKSVQEEAMFNYAKLEYELGSSFNPSIETVNRFLAEFPDSPNRDEARGYLMAAYLNNKNYAAAYEAVTAIQNPDEETRAALQKIAYYRGLELFTEGDYAGARRMFDVAAANRFSARYNALTKFWQAETFYRLGEYARAVPLYQDYIVLSPRGERENGLAHYNLAYCYFNLKNWPQARTWFERYLALDVAMIAEAADARNRLGDLDYLDRNYAAAIAQYDWVIRIDTRQADYARFQRAIALGLTSGAAAKIAALREIAGTESEYAADALFELGSTYTRQEQFAEAASTLQRFIEQYPDSPRYPDALLDLGLIHQNMGRNEQAMTYYKQVVERAPGSSQARDAQLGIRNLYVDASDLPGYFAYAEGAGMETDTGAIARDSLTFSVAERVYLSSDARRSLPLMQSYLAQFPQGNYVAAATYYLADCQMQTDQPDAALEGFERVIAMRFSPFTLNALGKAAALHFERENYRASADEYRRLSELATNPATVAEALKDYIRSVDRLNDPQESLAAARVVMASSAVTVEVVTEVEFVRARAYAALGERAQALDAFRRVAAAGMKTRNGSEAQYRVAELLFEAGRLDEAETEIFAFSDTNTSYQYWLGRSFLLLGDIYRQRGDVFQAKATWQSIVDGYGDSSDGIVGEARDKLAQIE